MVTVRIEVSMTSITADDLFQIADDLMAALLAQDVTDPSVDADAARSLLGIELERAPIGGGW